MALVYSNLPVLFLFSNKFYSPNLVNKFTSFQYFSSIIQNLSYLFPISIRVNRCAKLIFMGTPRLDPGTFISLQQLVNAILVKHEYPLMTETY
jgi:hypothetical protein